MAKFIILHDQDGTTTILDVERVEGIETNSDGSALVNTFGGHDFDVVEKPFDVLLLMFDHDMNKVSEILNREDRRYRPKQAS